METKKHIYEAPECITVAISTKRTILTVSTTNMTLTLLDWRIGDTSLLDGGDLGSLD